MLEMKTKTSVNVFNCVHEAISRSKKFRSLNTLITETFDVASNQYENAIQKGLNPFTMIVKDCFAYVYV